MGPKIYATRIIETSTNMRRHSGKSSKGVPTAHPKATFYDKTTTACMAKAAHELRRKKGPDTLSAAESWIPMKLSPWTLAHTC